MDKNQREVRLRQEDADLNRGLLWVVGAVLLECLLMVVNRWYINFYPAEIGVAEAILNVMRVLRVGGGIVGILALVWSALCFRKGSRAGWPAVVGLALLALAVCAHVTLSYEKNGVRMLFMLVPAWAALALVYYLYQPECFLAVTAGGFGAVGLWFVRFGGMTVDVALCLVGAVLVALVTLGLKKSDGALMQAGGKKVQWAPRHLLCPGAGQLRAGRAGGDRRRRPGQQRGLLPDVRHGGVAVCPGGLLHREDDVMACQLES